MSVKINIEIVTIIIIVLREFKYKKISNKRVINEVIETDTVQGKRKADVIKQCDEMKTKQRSKASS